MPKNLNNEDIEDVPVVDDALLETAAELVELPSAAPAAHGPVAGKRALGVKEPIIFKWKLIGTSNGMALTLFKAVEREDVDAQFERIQREAINRNLRIPTPKRRADQPHSPRGRRRKVRVLSEAARERRQRQYGQKSPSGGPRPRISRLQLKAR